MDMNDEKDRCIDCTACGYKTCRDMATAVFRGLNSSENCIHHAKSALTSGVGQTGFDYLQFTSELKTAVAGIQNDLNEINKTADSTGERANVVSDLLRNLVAFCNSNPVMDEGSVKQLTGILETTMSALGAFNQNVIETQGSTRSIADAIEKLNSFISTLSESEDLPS